MIDQSTPIISGARPFFLAGGSVGILIIHGYGGTIDDYRDAGRILQQAGYTVSGMRLAGHGQSLDALRLSSSGDWMESVHAAVEEMRSRCQRIVLFGISFGGDLALAYAAEHHDRIAGVITLNTPLRYRGGGAGQKIALRLLGLVTPYYAKPGLTPERKAQYAQTGSMTKWPIRGLLATYQFIEQRVLSGLPRVKVSALVMTVEHDELVDVDSAVGIHQALGSTSKRLVRIPGNTHRPFRDPSMAANILKEMQKFLREYFS